MLEILQNNWYIIVLFFTIALLYSSVGFGGGSSYLAVLTFSALAFTEIRATALLCNIIVVSGNVWLYEKNKVINWKKTIPLVLVSVPTAFLGGYLKITQEIFFILLGFTLLTAAFLTWFTPNQKNEDLKNQLSKNMSFGGIVGFISGMVGIGGGIFLAPILHITKWDTSKKIAATASLFILVNSLAGLGGQFANNNIQINYKLTSILLVVVFIGGQIGSRISHQYFSASLLKKATSILIAFVSLRILFKYLAVFLS